MSHTRLALIVLFLSFVSSVSRAQDSQPATVISLVVREPGSSQEQFHPLSILMRELIRQAFLLSARDECGLLTRDRSLREECPGGQANPMGRFELYCDSSRVKPDFDVRYVLTHVLEKSTDTPWEWTWNVDINTPEMLTTLCDKAEELSRGSFREIFQKLGSNRPLPPARPTAAVPAAAQTEIWEWNELDLYVALRRIHAEIREHGESPELLAGLALAYANLGSVTEYHFSAASKVYFARAMLYAERLVKKSDQSSWALWHRAYVRAIDGLHHLAEVDIAAAKKKQGKDKPVTELPPWTTVLDHFCQGRITQMHAACHAPLETRLALYLDLIATRVLDMDDLTVERANAMLKACPRCLRALDTLAGMPHIGVRAEATSESFQQFGTLLRERLKTVPGLPEKVLKRVTDSQPNENIDAEVEYRIHLLDDLAEASAPERDAAEPSLGVLTDLIVEIEFKQLIRRLEYLKSWLGVSTDATIASMRPLGERHPLYAFIDAYSDREADRTAAAKTLLAELRPVDLGYVESVPARWLVNYDKGRANELWNRCFEHADPIFRDEAEGVRLGAASTVDDRRINGPYARKLWRTSSKLPTSVALRIMRDWEHARNTAPGLEREYADESIVIRTLMEKYIELKQEDDAVRCAKQAIKLRPDIATVERLAKIYWSKGDKTAWKATLESGLKLPSMGLEHARICSELAHYHLRNKEYDEAVLFGDQAADSYSAWGLAVGARCHEMLKHWDRAEESIRAMSERYSGQEQICWVLWCYRTGHGDKAAAENAFARHLESYDRPKTALQAVLAGDYHLLRKEYSEALEDYNRANDARYGHYAGMHAALVADAMGKNADRDKLLAQLSKPLKRPTPQNSVYSRLAGLMRQMLAAREPKAFDLTPFDKLIESSSRTVSSTTLECFVGRFLQNRQLQEKSREYLLRSAGTTYYQSADAAIACALLNADKIPLPPPTRRDALFDKE